MKQIRHSLPAALVVVMAAVSSCSTSVVHRDIPMEDPDKRDEPKTLIFHVTGNSFTRAGEDNEIKTLTLAFYKIADNTQTFLSKHVAEWDESRGVYITQLGLSEQVPNTVVAFANLPEGFNVEGVLANNPTMETLLSGEDFVMSNAGYYKTLSSSSYWVDYTDVTDANLKNGVPVQIYLERIGAKVTVSKEGASLGNLTYLNADRGDRTLNPTLTKWDVIGTDKGTYLLKDNGGLSFSGMTEELGADNQGWKWNDADAHTLKWAHSLNWSSVASDFPSPGEETASSLALYRTFDQISREFGSSGIYHETTRPSTLYSTPNALPSVILAGHYLIDDATNPQTLYRQGNYVLTLDELIHHLAQVNSNEKLLYHYKDKKANLYDETTLGSILRATMSSPYFVLCQYGSGTPNIITLQIIPENAQSPSVLCNTDGNKLTAAEIATLNNRLAEEIGLWEIFEDGAFFYHIPIQHSGAARDFSQTGVYGLVRNHHYNISLKNIDKIGHGVKKGECLGAWPYPADNAAGSISYVVSVNDWTEVSQDINIPR